MLVLWRSSGTRTALVAAFPGTPLVPAAPPGVGWQLADTEGQVITGEPLVPQRAAARVTGNAENPWTLHVWPAGASRGGRASRVTLLIAAMAAMLLFVWAAALLMARALAREAAVARLQSDFVAAVSHEFRSPLTTMRQMAEMLETGRVPATRRRRKQYYRVLAGETARLQRLVETAARLRPHGGRQAR